MNGAEDLGAYGLSPAMRDAANARAAAGESPARVTAVHKERFDLVCDHGACHGRLKSSVYFNGGTQLFPTVGDFVLMRYNALGESTITQTMPRRSFFARKNPTLGEPEQAVAANFEIVFLMQSLNQDLNPRRLERYLTLAWQSGAVPVVLLTKADLAPSHDEQLRQIASVAVGADAFAISAKTGYGFDTLGGYLRPGRTIALLGSSGVGKSSLVNALAGEARMAVGGIREDDGRGRHTTTHRQLILLESGVMIIDTPGMRELGLQDAGTGLSESFADVEQYFSLCRFSNCAHEREPGCAVQAAIRAGELPLSRFESYKKLRRESQYAADQAAYLRRKQQRFSEIARQNRAAQSSGGKRGTFPGED